ILAAVMLLPVALIHWKANRPVIFSLLFYSLCTFPLLQLFPVGDAVRADRYAYLAGIGLLMLCALVFEHFIRQSAHGKLFVQLVFLMYVFFLSQATFAQCKNWKNGIVLWSTVISKYPQAVIAYVNRGSNYSDTGKSDEA